MLINLLNQWCSMLALYNTNQHRCQIVSMLALMPYHQASKDNGHKTTKVWVQSHITSICFNVGFVYKPILIVNTVPPSPEKKNIFIAKYVWEIAIHQNESELCLYLHHIRRKTMFNLGFVCKPIPIHKYSLLNWKSPYIKSKVNCVFTFYISAVKAPTLATLLNVLQSSDPSQLEMFTAIRSSNSFQLITVHCFPQFMLLLTFQSRVQSHIAIHEEQTFNFGFVCKPIPIQIFIAKYLCMGNRHTSKVK